MIILGFILSSFFSMTYSCSFYKHFKETPVFLETNSSVSLEYTQNTYPNFLWHKHFLGEKHLAHSGKGVVVAILDTELPDGNKNASCCDSGALKLNTSARVALNFANNDLGCVTLVIDQKNKKRLSWLMQKKQFWLQLLQKNHGYVSRNIIQEMAPDVMIIVIPILDEQGCASKLELYHGLLQALQANVDVVHLGLQVFDWRQEGELEQKIIALIKLFPYVVAPAGNCRLAIDHVGYPAAIPGVISVGSFGKTSRRYMHSDFCQATEHSPVSFVMPGENIWSTLWVSEIQDYVVVPVSGTSFSAAFMTGLLACVLEKNNNQLCSSRIVELLELCSYKRDASWNRCVKYGMPATDEILLHLNELMGLKKKNVDHYFRKLRNSMSR